MKAECSVDSDSGCPQEKLSSAPEMRKDTVLQKEEIQPAKSLSVSQDPPDEGRTSGVGSKGSPKSTPSSMEQDMMLSSPPRKPEDSASGDPSRTRHWRRERWA